MNLNLIPSDLLFTRVDGTQRFTHDTNLEYFLALHFASNGILPPSNISSNVKILFSGMSQHASSFIRDANLPLEVAALCYSESQNKDESLEKKLVDTAVTILDKPFFATEEDCFNAAHALSQLKSSYFLPHAKKLFLAVHKKIREYAAYILNAYSFEDVFPILETCSKNRQWYIRWNVIDCLASYSNPQAVEKIKTMTRDRDFLIQSKAQLALRPLTRSSIDQIAREFNGTNIVLDNPLYSKFLPLSLSEYELIVHNLTNKLSHDPENVLARIQLFLVYDLRGDYDAINGLFQSSSHFLNQQWEKKIVSSKDTFLGLFLHELSGQFSIFYDYPSGKLNPKNIHHQAMLSELDMVKQQFTLGLNSFYSLALKGDKFISRFMERRYRSYMP